MIRRQQLRLQKLFGRIMLLAIGAPTALEAACTSAAPGAPSDSGTDATTATPNDSGALAPTGDAGADAPSCTAEASAPYVSDASYAQLADAAADAPYYTCYYFVDLPCTSPETTESCYLTLAECAQYCTMDGGFVDCLYWQGAGCNDGSVTVQPPAPATIGCGVCSGVGRRPAGLAAAPRSQGVAQLGEYFAEMAYLEAASVHAFVRLRRELEAHGAPARLREGAERSARDEIRHARLATGLARRFGAMPKRPKVRRQRVRSLERVARENAVEGCVRETFGAMVASWQASHAADEGVRKAMGGIAVDEARHAALAWAVAHWAAGRLDSSARARVLRARRAAVSALRREISVQRPRGANDAGIPSAKTACALLDAMSELWG